jgi:hypothetical protein
MLAQSKLGLTGLFQVGKHGQMPSPRLGQQSHHGAMSAWMKKHYPGYNPNKAPAILMPQANHQATFGVYNKWRAAWMQKWGNFSWAKVSLADMKKLSTQMFDAANVPPAIRQEYWVEFAKMIAAMTKP